MNLLFLLQKNSNYTLRVGCGGITWHNEGKGHNTILSGPGIDNIGIQAHAGGYGATGQTSNHGGGVGGSGGGGANGVPPGVANPGFPNNTMAWYDAITSYGNNGGYGQNNEGGGGGGGAGGVGLSVAAGQSEGAAGGPPIELYGETMAGGGGGRNDWQWTAAHGTSYNAYYGSGGRATERPSLGGLAMLRFNEDQAITGHNYSVNLFND